MGKLNPLVYNDKFYNDKFYNDKKLITTTVVAKDLGLTARQLNKVLYNNKILYKTDTDLWFPYSEYIWLLEDGYLNYKRYYKPYPSVSLQWTLKGSVWLVSNFNLLNKDI